MIKVLLVDDEPLVRRGIRSILPLSQFGMEWAGEASTAEEALALLQQVQIDLVLTDISMPGMDGLAFIKSLQDTHPSIVTVVITCHQDFDYLQQALRLGAVDYIVKTQLDDHSVHELLERIAGQVGKRAGLGRNGTGGGSGRGTGSGETDDPFLGKQFAERWGELAWIARDAQYAELLDETMRKLDGPLCRDVFAASAAEWEAHCPPLQELAAGAVRQLADLSTLAALHQWIEAFRREALARLCSTMHSEQVITSVLLALDFMREHAGEKWSQADICRRVSMSISYFSKCFKEIVGVSFVHYVQEANLRMAQRLLETTNLPVYEVADKSGFSDEKYFGKIFRIKLGCAPSEYRLQHRGR